MTAYAGAAWLQLLLSSPHKLLGAAVAPAVGAAVAAALWRQLRSWQQQQGWASGHLKGSSSPMVPFAGEVGAAGLILALPLSESPVGGSRDCSHGSEDNSSSSSSSECHYSKPLPAQFPQPGGATGPSHQQYHTHTQQQHVGEGVLLTQVVTTPSEHHLCSSQMRHQRVSDSGAAPAWTHQHHQQPGVHYQPLDVQQQQHLWQQPPTSGASWDQQSTSSSNSSSSSPVRAVGASSLLLPGRGDVLLHVGAAAADSFQGSGCRLFEPRKKRDSWGFAGPGYSRVQGSSQAVAAASMLSVGGAAVTGIPLGLQLAAALTADPTNSGHAVVPMVMLGA